MNNGIKVESQFTTKEISLVAFLDLNGVKPVECQVIRRGSKNLATFKFNKTDEFLKLKSQYFDGEGSVEPMNFMDAIRRIKTKINNMEG